VQRAEAAYRSGRSYHALGENREAARHYRLAADNPGDTSARWGPWSRFHLGEVLAADGDVDGARRMYRAVLADENEFDYHQALEQRARAALESLN
jgi:tetratricopeptide (TPR) repeat protein